VGEDRVCDVTRAVRLKAAKLTLPSSDRTLFAKPLFRRLYSDGRAVAKYELGFVIKPRGGGPKRPCRFEELSSAVAALNTAIHIPYQQCEWRTTTLGQAGAPLAEHFAVSSTRWASAYARSSPPKAVRPGPPLIVLEATAAECRILEDQPQLAVQCPISGSRLSQAFVSWGNRKTPMWILTRESQHATAELRQFRIVLMRLHAEQHSLRTALMALADASLDPPAASDAANQLQLYLRQTCRWLLDWRKRGDYTEVVDAAVGFSDLVVPGQRHSLQERLTNVVSIRPNILRRVQELLDKYERAGDQHNITILGDYYMSSKYNISGGNQGQVGDGNIADKIVFGAPETPLSASDQKMLLAELVAVRAALAKRGDASGAIAAGELAKAEQAVSGQDKSALFDALKRAGKIAYDVAASVGAKMLAALISKQIGIG
jgi:hypothetical protein